MGETERGCFFFLGSLKGKKKQNRVEAGIMGHCL